MSCNENHIEIHFDGANDPERCKCRSAVLRAYKLLLQAGQPSQYALEAAKIVYAHHHPKDSKFDRALTVERWVNAGHFH